MGATVQVEIFETQALGDRSYVVHDGRAAVVVDPQRDVDRLNLYLRERELSVELVLETHVHNDYVSGGFALARQHGCRYGLNAADAVSFARFGLIDGDELEVGDLKIGVIATPGHTFTHLSYAVSDSHALPAVFSGGSLLFGSVGRTDLIGPAAVAPLSRAQYRSANRLASRLPEQSSLYPTHGFGSFCSSGAVSSADSSTIGRERSHNDALTAPSEGEFVTGLLANLGPYPSYYAHMADINRAGPTVAAPGKLRRLDAEELHRRLSAQEWVVDVRRRAAYASDHLRGTIGIELGDQFTSYCGWLSPWGEPLTLVGETEDTLEEAVRDLYRIGIENVEVAVGELDDLTAPGQERETYPRVQFDELREMRRGDQVLDVRQPNERAQGWIPGSIQIPMQFLLDQIADLGAARTWVHCASGYRAGIAASMIDRAGLSAVHIDDDFDTAIRLGLTTTDDDFDTTIRLGLTTTDDDGRRLDGRAGLAST